MRSFVERALRAPRCRLIAMTLEHKRREHPSLVVAPSSTTLEAIASAEGIEVHYEEPPRSDCLGMSLDFLGYAIVVVVPGLPARVSRRILAHELGHIWLGHCADPLLWAWTHETARLGDADRAGIITDRTEDEANLFSAQSAGHDHRQYYAPLEAMGSCSSRVCRLRETVALCQIRVFMAIFGSSLCAEAP